MNVSPSYRKQRRERLLERSKKGVAARQRKHQERIAAGWEFEPKFKRWYPLELGVRDKRTGETAWVDLCSVRNVTKRLSVVMRYYV